MILYRALRKNEENIIEASKRELKYKIVDYVYSNCVPSHVLFEGERIVWSLSKTPEAALQWLGSRGKGRYNRLAYFDFSEKSGKLYDLTDIRAWVTLISNSKSLKIRNINCNSVIETDAIRMIIPCMGSVISMARACEEVVFIPEETIEFKIVNDLSEIPRNNENESNILYRYEYDNDVIDGLLHQLENYPIKRKKIVEDALKRMKK